MPLIRRQPCVFSGHRLLRNLKLQKINALKKLKINYLLIGIAVFLRGIARIVALLISVALIGLNPLILMPVWLFGVALWRIVRQPQVHTSMLAAVLLTALFPVFYLCGHNGPFVPRRTGSRNHWFVKVRP